MFSSLKIHNTSPEPTLHRRGKKAILNHMIRLPLHHTFAPSSFFLQWFLVPCVFFPVIWFFIDTIITCSSSNARHRPSKFIKYNIIQNHKRTPVFCVCPGLVAYGSSYLYFFGGRGASSSSSSPSSKRRNSMLQFLRSKFRQIVSVVVSDFTEEKICNTRVSNSSISI